MESNSCGKNNLNLPPRKRLLAGLKKCTFDPPSDSSENGLFEAGVNNLMSSHLGNPDLSLEEVVEASKTAATSALKLAVRAKAVAVEKAEIAATKIAIAKRTLDLVASLSENGENKKRYLKKNRIRHKKRRPIVNSKMDEELARNPHGEMSSSTRVSNSSPASKNGGLKFNGNGFIGELNNVRVDESMSNLDKSKIVEEVEEAGRSRLQENKFESLDGGDTNCRERGIMEQKRVALKHLQV